MGLHIHGLVKPNSQDGAPDIEPATPKVNPGESYTYKFRILQSEIFFYHSSNPTQIIQGLVGPFVVLPRERMIPPYNIPVKTMY
jgi:manganese oxidase